MPHHVHFLRREFSSYPDTWAGFTRISIPIPSGGKGRPTRFYTTCADESIFWLVIKLSTQGALTGLLINATDGPAPNAMVPLAPQSAAPGAREMPADTNTPDEVTVISLYL